MTAIMQTTDTQPSAQIGEIVIRGLLADAPDAPYAVSGVARINEVEAWRGRPARVITAGEVIAQIEDLARWKRHLLVEVDCMGGTVVAGWAIHDALRRFATGGRSVLTFVERAASAGVDVALAGDLVVATWPSPGRYACHSGLPFGFGVHAAIWQSALSPEENEIARSTVRAGNLQRIASRVATPPEVLSAWMSLGDSAESSDLPLAYLNPDEAVAHGWADLAASRDVAAGLVEMMASGHRLHTLRQAMLEGEVPRSAFPCPPATRFTLDRAPYAQEIA